MKESVRYATTMATIDPDTSTASRLDRSLRILIAGIPLFAVVPVGFLWILRNEGGAFRWIPFAIGAAGWTLALGLRAPIALVGKRIGLSDRVFRFVSVAVSGPAEESVRVGAVVVFARSFGKSFSLGLGWASIEIVYAIVAGLMTLILLQRDDDKAKEALAYLESQGRGLDEMEKAGKGLVFGVVERGSASAYHIGATLLLWYNPLLVLVLIPIHSGMNLLTFVPQLRKSTARMEAAVAVVGGAVFVWGLVSIGRL